MKSPLRQRLVLGAIAALLVSSALTIGCDDNAASLNPAAPRQPVRSVTITISPEGVSPSAILIVPPVAIQVVNIDSVPHMLHLDNGNLSDGCRAFDSLGTLVPGETKMTGVITDQANICTFHDHLFHGDPRFAGRIVIDSVE